jgi:hypothetical protein
LNQSILNNYVSMERDWVLPVVLPVETMVKVREKMRLDLE